MDIFGAIWSISVVETLSLYSWLSPENKQQICTLDSNCKYYLCYLQIWYCYIGEYWIFLQKLNFIVYLAFKEQLPKADIRSNKNTVLFILVFILFCMALIIGISNTTCCGMWTCNTFSFFSFLPQGGTE